MFKMPHLSQATEKYSKWCLFLLDCHTSRLKLITKQDETFTDDYIEALST